MIGNFKSKKWGQISPKPVPTSLCFGAFSLLFLFLYMESSSELTFLMLKYYAAQVTGNIVTSLSQCS